MLSFDSEIKSQAPAVQHRDNKSFTQLGQISFVNTLPVVLPFLHGVVQADCQLVFGTPAELNQKLQRRELELGAMSSFYFLEDGGFELFREISISGADRVGSVLLFSKDELKDLHGKLVDVPDCSATSIKLMQLLFLEEFGIEPVLRKQLDSLESRHDARAVLLIGDRALKYDEVRHSYLRVDLSQWWFKSFSLPFVFGVWGARKNWAQNNQDRFKLIGDSLVHACSLGLTSMLPDVINEASRRTGLTHTRLSSYYLNELDYRLNEKHIQALELFGKLCREHGFLATS